MLGWVEFYARGKPGPGYYDPEGAPGEEMIKFAQRRINGARPSRSAAPQPLHNRYERA